MSEQEKDAKKKDRADKATPDDIAQSNDNDIAAVKVASGLSVFDRLKAQRAAGEGAHSGGRSPESATIEDVASAIAAVDADPHAAEKAAALKEAPMSDEAIDGDAASARNEVSDSEQGELTVEVFDAGDPRQWKRSIVRSINETRDELKHAHKNVTGLRRRLADMERRRTQGRARLIASLERADAALSDLRDGSR